MPLHRLFACVLEHVDAVLFLAFHCEEQGVMVVGVDVMGEASRSALILEDTLTGVDVATLVNLLRPMVLSLSTNRSMRFCAEALTAAVRLMSQRRMYRFIVVSIFNSQFSLRIRCTMACISGSSVAWSMARSVCEAKSSAGTLASAIWAIASASLMSAFICPRSSIR